ncbi:hypothetical protein [Enterococcus gilvus]|uniref:Uncharacterized protein n=1 Tax=Enterococcus gilvus ATCC BAA-350 TaxID=1158614 RepID=R2XVE2_9ENTE|nr:hypothetical protein [Enterococcus gilvus]EOI53932.1 hypothetical protein UKC_03885 [Enterococcus gilvus ATCC BAA-350]EOW80793.1 hypothetical protein I592_00077 [Enterococcus gilvus ATCC BAA-350]MBS5821201.1 hypothetical protein [Enterococcus gilvus]
MWIINWISVGLLLIGLFVWARRMFIKVQLERIPFQQNTSFSFQRKLDYVKQSEQTKHVSALLYLIFILSVGMLLMTYSLFQIDQELQSMKARNSLLRDELYTLKKAQTQIITKLPIKPYPSKGIGLKNYAWEELFSEESREKQYEIEIDLSDKVSSYFGLSTTLIVLDVPSKTMNIALAGDSGNEENRKQIKQNIRAFVKEAEDVENITQVNFQMNLMNDRDKKKVYSCTFSRENGEEEFSLIKEEE